MKIKINIALKIAGLICSIIVFVFGIINIAKGLTNDINYILIVVSIIAFLCYLAEWFVTRAWFRIAYWLAFVVINPIMLMDDDTTRVIRNTNSSMFIFSIFYLIIMAIAVFVLVYQYTNNRKKEIKIDKSEKDDNK